MPTHTQKLARRQNPGFTRVSGSFEIDFTSLDVAYVTDSVEFNSRYHMDEMIAVDNGKAELYHEAGSSSLLPYRYDTFDVVSTSNETPPYFVSHQRLTDRFPNPRPNMPIMIRAGTPNFPTPYENIDLNVSVTPQTGIQTPPFDSLERRFRAIPGKFRYERDGYSKTFEVRELALENFRVDQKVCNPESVSPFVTIRGDVRVYPNMATNGMEAWKPENDIDWQVQLKHPLIPNIVLTGTIVPSEPDETGLVGELEIQWDPAGLATLIELPLEIDGALRLMLDVGGGTVSRPVTTHCIISRGRCTDWFTGLVRETQAVSVYSGSPELSTTLAYSGASSGSAPASFGYGWFSTESIKIVPLPDESIVYCDEMGLFRRWEKIGVNQYKPLFEDNTLALTVSSNPNSMYTVTWRDQSRRVFDADGKLRSSVDRNGRTTNYTKALNYFSVADEYGRVVYNHFRTGELQPYIINDNADPGLGRRYQLKYYMDGTDQKELKSITDPVGDKVVYEYDSQGRIHEMRQELRDHHRSIVYEYETTGTDRLKSKLVKSVLLNANPDLNQETEHFQVSYTYNVPLSFPNDPYEIHDYIATQIVTEDKQVIGLDPNAEVATPAKPSMSFVAYDSMSRVVGEFEIVKDELSQIQERTITEETHIATLHRYNGPTDPNSLSADPQLRTETLQFNKNATTKWLYDSRGNVKSIIDDHDNETVLTYMWEENPSHPQSDLVTKVRRPAKDRLADPQDSDYFYQPKEIVYDSTGNVQAVRDSEGNWSFFTYTSNGLLKRAVNRRGFKTYIEYDSMDRMWKLHTQKGKLPSSLTIEGFEQEPVPEDFRTVTITYDDYDNMLAIVDANSNSIEVTEYDDIDRIKTLIDGNGVAHSFVYANQVLESASLPDSNTGLPSYLLEERTGRQAEIVYDSIGRPLEVLRKDDSHPPELRVGFAYDGLSRTRSLVRLKNGYRRSHKVEHDRQGRPTKSIDANNTSQTSNGAKFSTMDYEPICVGFAQTTARGVRRRVNFDSLCRMTQVEVGSPDPENGLTVVEATETRTYLYDDLGRLLKTTQDSASGGSVYGQAVYGTNAYGASGSASMEERSYVYDSLDRVEKVTFEDGKTMEYFYDFEGNVTRVVENASGTPKTTLFSYYGDNRLYQVTYVRASGNQVFTYDYDPGGRPETLTYPASTGIVAEFEGPNGEPGWDGNGQLKHLRYMKGTDTIRRFAFEYDLAGNRISQLDVVDIAQPITQRAVEWVYGYDWLDRLESVKKREATTVAGLALEPLQLTSMYQYDAADNRIEFKVPNLQQPALTETFTYGYDAADNILSISKAVGTGSAIEIEAFTSDDDGNLKTRTSGGVTTTYTWNDFNRLAAITASDNSKKQSHTFGVNGFRRKKKDKNDVETTEYAASLATAVSTAQTGDTVAYLTAHRLMGLERESDGAMFWFVTDSLSTIRDVVDSSGEVKASYEFSEYGKRLSDSMSNTVESQKTFVGGQSVQDEVADTSLMMMGHRFYDPGLLGRFLSRDPIGFNGGLNLFEYSRSSPIQFTDATGLQSGDPFKDVYGINDAQQAATFEAGLIFLGVLGTALTISIPDASDLALSATVAGIVKTARGIKQVGKGSRYWKFGEATESEERVAQMLSDRGFEVFLTADNKLFQKHGACGIPDIRINGQFWDIKTPKLETSVYSGVKQAMKHARKQQNVERVILDFTQHEGTTFNEVFKDLQRVFNGSEGESLQLKIREVIVLTPRGEPILVPTWKF